MDINKIKVQDIQAPSDKEGVILSAVTCIKHAFMELRVQVKQRMDKIDRVTTGADLLIKCRDAIQLCQRAFLCKNDKDTSKYLEEAYFTLSDISTVLGLYRDCKMISVERHAEIGQHIGHAAKLLHILLRSCKPLSWK